MPKKIVVIGHVELWPIAGWTKGVPPKQVVPTGEYDLVDRVKAPVESKVAWWAVEVGGQLLGASHEKFLEFRVDGLVQITDEKGDRYEHRAGMPSGPPLANVSQDAAGAIAEALLALPKPARGHAPVKARFPWDRLLRR